MKHTWLFMISLVGLTISGVVLISLIPPLFESGEHANIWLLGGLVVLAAAFAVGTRYWRPPTPNSDGQ